MLNPGKRPSRLDARLLRRFHSSSSSCLVCARGVERSIYRATSVLTGDTDETFY
jgi:hypothetical protein